MKQENSRCLVLNGDYSPLGIIDWKKAFIWSIKHYSNLSNGIEIIDFYKNDCIIGTGDKKYPIPCVAKTKKYYRLHSQTVNFSRKNLFTRDNYTCQYCGLKKDINKLTYDHVIPKSLWKNKRSSATCWTNIVTACMECNRKKRNRTPIEANMPLLSLPVMPRKSLRYLPIAHHILTIRDNIPDEWRIYLPDSYVCK